jgi:hypothetical protein
VIYHRYRGKLLVIYGNSLSGGSGSGLTSTLLQNMCNDYGKKLKITSTIFPSTNVHSFRCLGNIQYSDVIVAPYNAVMGFEALVEYTDLTIMMDNESLYNNLSKLLNLSSPSLININRQISHIMSSITACNRYQGNRMVTICS